MSRDFLIREAELERDRAIAKRDVYIRAFNSLEKAVTKCIGTEEDTYPDDAAIDQLERSHRIIMNKLADGTI